MADPFSFVSSQTPEESSFDWMSMIPMLLGTAASIRNPQAGNQLIGIGDYLRRDRMASLSAERERRMAEAQRRRQELQDQQNAAGVNALRQQFPQYTIPDVPFDAARHIVNIQEDQRRQTLAERRREAQVQAARGASEASTRYRTGGVSAADQLRALQGRMAELDLESQSKFQPDLKYLQEATQREAQAHEMMSSVPQLDPAQQGPELLDPDTRKEIASGYGRGEITSIPAALERRGRQPNIIPEGEPYLAEQLGQVSKQQQAITSQMKDYIIQRHAQGLPISFGQAQVAGFAGTTPGSMDRDTMAALKSGVSPWELPYMDPARRQAGAATAVQSASTEAARREVETERLKTPELANRAALVEWAQNPALKSRAQTASDISVAGEVEKQRRLNLMNPKPVAGETAVTVSAAQEARTAADRLMQTMKDPRVQQYQGPAAQWWMTAQRNVPNAILGEIPPVAVDYQQDLATLRNYFVKLMSGAQVSAQEAERLKAQLPSESSRPVVFQREMENTSRSIRNLEGRIISLALRGDQIAARIANEVGLQAESDKPKVSPPKDERKPTMRYNPKTGRLEPIAQ